MITVTHGRKFGYKEIVTPVIRWSIFFNVSKPHKLQDNKNTAFIITANRIFNCCSKTDVRCKTKNKDAILAR
jgi:hypothetical protein